MSFPQLLLLLLLRYQPTTWMFSFACSSKVIKKEKLKIMKSEARERSEKFTTSQENPLALTPTWCGMEGKWKAERGGKWIPPTNTTEQDPKENFPPLHPLSVFNFPRRMNDFLCNLNFKFPDSHDFRATDNINLVSIRHLLEVFLLFAIHKTCSFTFGCFSFCFSIFLMMNLH